MKKIKEYFCNLEKKPMTLLFNFGVTPGGGQETTCVPGFKPGLAMCKVHALQCAPTFRFWLRYQPRWCSGSCSQC